MGVKSKFILFILSIFLLSLVTKPVTAATIFGSIYDISLQKQSNVRISINTSPQQQLIAKEGTYSFSVAIGSYTLNASYIVEDMLISYAEENIIVLDEGEYVIDLILFPSFQEEYNILNEYDLEVPEQILVEERIKKEFPYHYLFIVVIASLLALFLYLQKKPHQSKEKETEQVKEPPKEDVELNDYISFIKEQKRTTQKEIRKQFPLSEAKISLILTELEEKGIIRKIKKGRGNIIIYNKREG